MKRMYKTRAGHLTAPLLISGFALSVSMGPTCGVDDPMDDDLRTFVDPSACQDIDASASLETFTRADDYEHMEGIVPVLVIMVEWENFPASTVTPDDLDAFFFGGREPSVRNYFLHQSGGKFTIKRSSEDYPYPAVTDWVSTGVTESSITHSTGDGSRNPDWFKTVMNAYVDQAGVNIADYDADGDGKVEKNEVQIVIVDTLSRLGAMRPHTIEVNASPGSLSSPSASTYAVENNFVFLGRGSGAMSFPNLPFGSTACHELSHALLDLPDRYMNGGSGTGYGGTYDPMSDNLLLLQLNPYDRVKFGWLEPKILTKADAQGVFCIRANDALYGSLSPAIILWDSGRYPDADQYFIIENRKSGVLTYDRPLEDGLAVWAVDENKSKRERVTLVSWQSLGMAPRAFMESGDWIGPGSADGDGHLFRDRDDVALIEDSFNLRYADGTESRFTIYGVSPSERSSPTSGLYIYFGLI